jgi:AbrB family looped-hinge helix DNA binding protein
MATATVTSKGQVTIPQRVRRHLHLEEGDKLEFTIEDDGTVRLRTIKGSVKDLFGLLKRPGQRPVTVEEMDESVEELHAEDDERIRKGKP